MIDSEDLGLDEWKEEDAINLRVEMDAAAQSALLKAMAHTESSLSKAAEIFGISRATRYDLISRHVMQ
jgi:transcriptional regulator of acetoin/glycerol metabolism